MPNWLERLRTCVHAPNLEAERESILNASVRIPITLTTSLNAFDDYIKNHKKPEELLNLPPGDPLRENPNFQLDEENTYGKIYTQDLKNLEKVSKENLYSSFGIVQILQEIKTEGLMEIRKQQEKEMAAINILPDTNTSKEDLVKALNKKHEDERKNFEKALNNDIDEALCKANTRAYELQLLNKIYPFNKNKFNKLDGIKLSVTEMAQGDLQKIHLKDLDQFKSTTGNIISRTNNGFKLTLGTFQSNTERKEDLRIMAQAIKESGHDSIVLEITNVKDEKKALEVARLAYEAAAEAGIKNIKVRIPMLKEPNVTKEKLFGGMSESAKASETLAADRKRMRGEAAESLRKKALHAESTAHLRDKVKGMRRETDTDSTHETSTTPTLT